MPGTIPVRLKTFLLMAALSVSASLAASPATSATIVALGASNAAGYGVSAEQAWPAQLEHMLRAKGYDVNVVVNAVSGDTSAGILGRVDGAIPAGTRAVVFDAGISNDRRRSVSPAETAANIAQIKAHIRAHGAVPIMTNYAGIPRQADGVHSSPEGHAMLAARLASQVAPTLKKGR